MIYRYFICIIFNLDILLYYFSKWDEFFDFRSLWVRICFYSWVGLVEVNLVFIVFCGVFLFGRISEVFLVFLVIYRFAWRKWVILVENY